jgi:hypothetical protein
MRDPLEAVACTISKLHAREIWDAVNDRASGNFYATSQTRDHLVTGADHVPLVQKLAQAICAVSLETRLNLRKQG